jgi:nuclear pore complex protein Nup205
LLKMLALALHISDISSSVYREACMAILYHTFGQCAENFQSTSLIHSHDALTSISDVPAKRNKVTLAICYPPPPHFLLFSKVATPWIGGC